MDTKERTKDSETIKTYPARKLTHLEREDFGPEDFKEMEKKARKNLKGRR